jgi:hypothetical protein
MRAPAAATASDLQKVQHVQRGDEHGQFFEIQSSMSACTVAGYLQLLHRALAGCASAAHFPPSARLTSYTCPAGCSCLTRLHDIQDAPILLFSAGRGDERVLGQDWRARQRCCCTVSSAQQVVGIKQHNHCDELEYIVGLLQLEAVTAHGSNNGNCVDTP